MVLQPISSKLPNFLNALIPEEQEADQRKWYEVLTNLQETLRYISTYLFKVKKVFSKELLKLKYILRFIFIYRLTNLLMNKCKIIMFL